MAKIPQSSAYSGTGSGSSAGYTRNIPSSTGGIPVSQPASVRGPAGPPGPGSSVLVHDDLTTKANGTPTKFDSGQPYTYGGAGTLLPIYNAIIQNGGLTVPKPSSGGWASYPEVVCSQNVNRIGAEFSFEAGATTFNGALCLVVWSPGPYVPLSTATPAHFICGQKTWGFYVKPAMGNTALNLIAQGSYPTLTDGKRYRADCYLLNGQAILVLPTGDVVVVTDAQIATAQALGYSTPCWEPYAQFNTDARVFVNRLWADVVDPASVPTGGGITLAQFSDAFARIEARRAASTAVATEYNGAATFTLTTTATVLDATNLALTFTTPPTGNVILQVEAMLGMSAADTVVLGFNVNSTDYMSVVAASQIVNGRVTSSRKVLLAPNTQYTAVVKANKFSTGTATFTTGGGSATTMMRAIPCQ